MREAQSFPANPADRGLMFTALVADCQKPWIRDFIADWRLPNLGDHGLVMWHRRPRLLPFAADCPFVLWTGGAQFKDPLMTMEIALTEDHFMRADFIEPKPIAFCRTGCNRTDTRPVQPRGHGRAPFAMTARKDRPWAVDSAFEIICDAQISVAHPVPMSSAGRLC